MPTFMRDSASKAKTIQTERTSQKATIQTQRVMQINDVLEGLVVKYEKLIEDGITTKSTKGSSEIYFNIKDKDDFNDNMGKKSISLCKQMMDRLTKSGNNLEGLTCTVWNNDAFTIHMVWGHLIDNTISGSEFLQQKAVQAKSVNDSDKKTINDIVIQIAPKYELLITDAINSKIEKGFTEIYFNIRDKDDFDYSNLGKPTYICSKLMKHLTQEGSKFTGLHFDVWNNSKSTIFMKWNYSSDDSVNVSEFIRSSNEKANTNRAEIQKSIHTFVEPLISKYTTLIEDAIDTRSNKGSTEIYFNVRDKDDFNNSDLAKPTEICEYMMIYLTQKDRPFYELKFNVWNNAAFTIHMKWDHLIEKD